MRLSATVLGAPDPHKLAAFYEELLGWDVVEKEGPRPGQPAEDGWVVLRPPGGGTGLSFQYEPGYSPPVWPPAPGEQEMMMHLDIAVEDLRAAVVWACQVGARLAGYQPQEHVRVMLDPAGHPFDLFTGGAQAEPVFGGAEHPQRPPAQV
jgi:catechol 2,3-dioxygenase-like lactoylglutathione lyase family enzyme